MGSYHSIDQSYLQQWVVICDQTYENQSKLDTVQNQTFSSVITWPISLPNFTTSLLLMLASKACQLTPIVLLYVTVLDMQL